MGGEGGVLTQKWLIAAVVSNLDKVMVVPKRVTLEEEEEVDES